MISYQPIYIYFHRQIHYLFENQLTDKFYLPNYVIQADFCNFIHVVLCLMQKPKYISGGNLKGVPLFLLFYSDSSSDTLY